MFSVAKQLSITLGLYKTARAVHRAFFRSEAAAFKSHRALLSQFIEPDQLAFDVGANIGTRSEIMLSLGARVVAYEPQPSCARETRARGNWRLTVVEQAVGSEVGTAELHLKAGSVQASLLPDWQGGLDVGVLTVPVTTLDAEIAKFGKPAFCKIDVEGFEFQVLLGLSHPIDALSIEYHCSEDGILKIFDCLKHLSTIGDYEVNLIGGEDGVFILPNWLSVTNFLGVFPQCAAPYFWGDLFARRVQP